MVFIRTISHINMSKPTSILKSLLALLAIGLLIQLRLVLLEPSPEPPSSNSNVPIPRLPNANYQYQYQAPIQCPHNPEDRSPQSYIVYLQYHHTLEKHSSAINRDITPYVKDVYEEGRKMVYSSVGVDEGMLEAIMGDENVWFVECAEVLTGDAKEMKWHR